jgi:hypothetical protein
MQTNAPGLLEESELDTLEGKIEEEDCIRSLLWQLSAVQWNGMEYVLNNPRFQVLWRKACRIFEFYSGDMARCSVSNIQAFQEMVEAKYPQLINEMLTTSGIQAVIEIQEAAVARNNMILANDGSGEWFNMLYVGPVELLKVVWVSDINNYNQRTAPLFSLLKRDMNAWGYLDYFNKHIAEQFTNEEDIKKLFRPMSSSYNRLSRYIDTRTTLLLLSRLKSWDGVFQKGLDWSTGIRFSSLVEQLPQEFLELIRVRGDMSEIEDLSWIIITLINDPRTLEDTVFPVALLLLGIEEKKEAEKRNKVWYYSNWQTSRSDKIRSILARRFPERYISLLESLVWVKEEDWDKDESNITTSSLWDGKTRCAIAASNPERYLSVVAKLSDWEIFLALNTSVRNDKGRTEERAIDSLIQAGLGGRIIDILLGLDIEQWRMSDLLESLAQSNPQEFAQKVLDMEKIKQRPKVNIHDNPLNFRNILQIFIIKWAGEKVLEILEWQDYKDINIHTHALLYKHVQGPYLEAAKRKGFNFEAVAREMVNGSDKTIDELVNYLAHYAFSDSAYHARDSYSEFLSYQSEPSGETVE